MKLLKNCFGKNVPGKRFVFFFGRGAEAPKSKAAAEGFQKGVEITVRSFIGKLDKFDLVSAKQDGEKLKKGLDDARDQAMAITRSEDNLDGAGKSIKEQYQLAISNACAKGRGLIDTNLDNYGKKLEWTDKLSNAKADPAKAQELAKAMDEDYKKLPEVKMTPDEKGKVLDLVAGGKFVKRVEFIGPDKLTHTVEVPVTFKEYRVPNPMAGEDIYSSRHTGINAGDTISEYEVGNGVTIAVNRSDLVFGRINLMATELRREAFFALAPGVNGAVALSDGDKKTRS